MAQWGKNDASSNSVIWSGALVNKTPNTANRDAMYGNTTSGSFVTGQKVGVFAADTTEVGVSNGSVISITVINPGSGYHANAAVTVDGNATANAQANSIGRISAVNITAAGNSYSSAPSVAIAAPAAQAFNANTGVAANGFITISANKFQEDDLVTYLVAADNTAIVELTNAASYYIQASNSTGVYLASTLGGTAIELTASDTSETGHSLTGQTATAVATVSGGKGIAHPGWVIRREGTGGRTGRVHYETLVASGSMTGDGEDTILKDS